jgi:hypothetical protein
VPEALRRRHEGARSFSIDKRVGERKISLSRMLPFDQADQKRRAFGSLESEDQASTAARRTRTNCGEREITAALGRARMGW